MQTTGVNAVGGQQCQTGRGGNSSWDKPRCLCCVLMWLLAVPTYAHLYTGVRLPDGLISFLKIALFLYFLLFTKIGILPALHPLGYTLRLPLPSLFRSFWLINAPSYPGRQPVYISDVNHEVVGAAGFSFQIGVRGSPLCLQTVYRSRTVQAYSVPNAGELGQSWSYDERCSQMLGDLAPVQCARQYRRPVVRGQWWRRGRVTVLYRVPCFQTEVFSTATAWPPKVLFRGALLLFCACFASVN